MGPTLAYSAVLVCVLLGVMSDGIAGSTAASTEGTTLADNPSSGSDSIQQRKGITVISILEATDASGSHAKASTIGSATETPTSTYTRNGTSDEGAEVSTLMAATKKSKKKRRGAKKDRKKKRRTARAASTDSAETTQDVEGSLSNEHEIPTASYEQEDMLKLFMDVALKDGRPFSRYLIPRSVNSKKRKFMRTARKKLDKIYKNLPPEVRAYRDTINPDHFKLSVLDLENLKGCVDGSTTANPKPSKVASRIAAKRSNGGTRRKLDSLVGVIEKMVARDDIQAPEREELAEILVKLSKAYDSLSPANKARSRNKPFGPEATDIKGESKYSSEITGLWKDLTTAPPSSSDDQTTRTSAKPGETPPTVGKRWFSFNEPSGLIADRPQLRSQGTTETSSTTSKQESSKDSGFSYQPSNNAKKSLNIKMILSSDRRAQAGSKSTIKPFSLFYTMDPPVGELQKPTRKAEEATTFGFEKLKFVNIDEESTQAASRTTSLPHDLNKILDPKQTQGKLKAVTSSLRLSSTTGSSTVSPGAQMCKNLLGHIEGVLKQFMTVLNKTGSNQANATAAELKKVQNQISNQAKRILTSASSTSSERSTDGSRSHPTSSAYYHRAKTMIINDLHYSRGYPFIRTTPKLSNFYTTPLSRTSTSSRDSTTSSEDEESTTPTTSRSTYTTTTATTTKEHYRKPTWTMKVMTASDKSRRPSTSDELVETPSDTSRHDPKKLFSYIKAKYSGLRTTTGDSDESTSSSSRKSTTTETKTPKSAASAVTTKYDGLEIYDDRRAPTTTESTEDETEDPVFMELKEFISNTNEIRKKAHEGRNVSMVLDVPNTDIDDWGLCSIFTEDWFRDWSLGVRRRSIKPEEVKMQYMKHCLETLINKKKRRPTKAVTEHAPAVTAYYIPVTLAGVNVGPEVGDQNVDDIY